MKQRLTSDQLNQLTPKQQEKLREWWKFEDGDWYYDRVSESTHITIECCEDDYSSQTPDDDCLPLLSIGQCIQLLHEFVKERNNNRLMIWEMVNHLWNVEVLDKTDSKWGEEHFWIQDKEELIDALWQAVKAVL